MAGGRTRERTAPGHPEEKRASNFAMYTRARAQPFSHNVAFEEKLHFERFSIFSFLVQEHRESLGRREFQPVAPIPFSSKTPFSAKNLSPPAIYSHARARALAPKMAILGRTPRGGVCINFLSPLQNLRNFLGPGKSAKNVRSRPVSEIAFLEFAISTRAKYTQARARTPFCKLFPRRRPCKERSISFCVRLQFPREFTGQPRKLCRGT